ncbi:hypothetical protein GIB67_032607 [Kingdonia uniflora]|uniref:RNase H type-1 domain-containing protein n=1 Tax=Kingdonia uniflora TaxID=39325 RepID=A0A7J7L579_9MAGN|nr:hypothetical protein GIB67_032607 [Kingdonia uniflora]
MSEKKGRKSPCRRAMVEFSNFLDAACLTENEMMGATFTWYNGQKGVMRILSVLDKSLINDSWNDKFRNWKVKVFPQTKSDHYLLFGECNEIAKPCNIPFHYLQSWSKVDKFREMVKNCWKQPLSTTPLFNIMMKLRRLKVEIKIWKKKALDNAIHNKKELEGEILQLHIGQEDDETDDTLYTQMVLKTKELEQIEDKEEEDWHQRLREKWLLAGDRNTAYFHQTTHMKLANTCILEIIDQFGAMISNQDYIKDYIVNYYADKFVQHEVVKVLPVNNKMGNAPSICSCRWTLPNIGEVKQCCDGPALGNPGPSGIGVVYRDCEGRVLGTLSKAVGSTTNYLAEAQAIVDGVEKAIHRGWTTLWIVSDLSATIKAFISS